jgi:hypothetical protein
VNLSGLAGGMGGDEGRVRSGEGMVSLHQRFVRKFGVVGGSFPAAVSA